MDPEDEQRITEEIDDMVRMMLDDSDDKSAFNLLAGTLRPRLLDERNLDVTDLVEAQRITNFGLNPFDGDDPNTDYRVESRAYGALRQLFGPELAAIIAQPIQPPRLTTYTDRDSPPELVAGIRALIEDVQRQAYDYTFQHAEQVSENLFDSVDMNPIRNGGRSIDDIRVIIRDDDGPQLADWLGIVNELLMVAAQDEMNLTLGDMPPPPPSVHLPPHPPHERRGIAYHVHDNFKLIDMATVVRIVTAANDSGPAMDPATGRGAKAFLQDIVGQIPDVTTRNHLRALLDRMNNMHELVDPYFGGQMRLHDPNREVDVYPSVMHYVRQQIPKFRLQYLQNYLADCTSAYDSGTSSLSCPNGAKERLLFALGQAGAGLTAGDGATAEQLAEYLELAVALFPISRDQVRHFVGKCIVELSGELAETPEEERKYKVVEDCVTKRILGDSGVSALAPETKALVLDSLVWAHEMIMEAGPDVYGGRREASASSSSRRKTMRRRSSAPRSRRNVRRRSRRRGAKKNARSVETRRRK